MATLVATPAVLPSLDKALEIQSFERSQSFIQGTNDLRDDAQQPVVEEKHMQNLANLFVQHNAHKLLGIHLIHGHFKIPKGTALLGSYFEELILDQGTVMLDSFEMFDGNPRVCQSNETHAKLTSGNHKVFNAGKPLPKLDNVDDFKSALAEAGVL